MQPTLTITLNPDGGVNVRGPVQNKPVCLWMLEQAKLALMAHRPDGIEVAREMPKVVAPTLAGSK